MNEQSLFNGLITGWFLLAVAVFIVLFFVAAPYGRHFRGGWGPAIDSRMGWVIMEAASPVVFAVCFALGSNPDTFTTIIFFGLWEAHYVHRAFIYPFTLPARVRRMPLVIVGFGLLFNAINAYLNGRYIFTFSNGYTNEWLSDVRFISGLVVFITGFIINRRADQILRSLRQQIATDYGIPHGGLYRWISCPNYFGEIIIWIGWALATWSLPGAAFATWTVANLVPRARSHHSWYRTHFPDYPPERKRLLPGLW